MKASAPLMILILLSTVVIAQSNVNQTITNMSNTHIQEIAEGNITATIGSYVSSPFIFINMNYSNFSNTYYSPSGITSALTNLTSLGTPYTSYISNSSVVEINSTEYVVNRDIWFVSNNLTYTLQIPYSATYAYTNGSWLIEAEWFGTDSNAGSVLTGVQTPANLTTTTVPQTVETVNTTTTTATTTLLYTIPGQNGTQNSTSTSTGQSQPNLLIIVAAILLVAIVILYILTMRKKA